MRNVKEPLINQRFLNESFVRWYHLSLKLESAEAESCMEYQTEAYNERELVLDTRKQVLVFFGFLVICGCFFVVGYVFGKGAAQRTSTNYADVGAAVNLRMKDNPGSDAYSRMNEP